ncbi:hypothetical protein [Phocaeicola sartorii]|uniref:hypothetical protein n=1 Tax=Phocaeicola sartorii TaxID=671267 RepID=UPI003510D4AF
MVIQSLPAVADYPEYPPDRQVSEECGRTGPVGVLCGTCRACALNVLALFAEQAKPVR